MLPVDLFRGAENACLLRAPCEHNTDVLLAIYGVGTANIRVAGQFYERVAGVERAMREDCVHVEGQLLPFCGLHEGQLRPRCGVRRGPLPFEIQLSTWLWRKKICRMTRARIKKQLG